MAHEVLEAAAVLCRWREIVTRQRLILSLFFSWSSSVVVLLLLDDFVATKDSVTSQLPMIPITYNKTTENEMARVLENMKKIWTAEKLVSKVDSSSALARHAARSYLGW